MSTLKSLSRITVIGLACCLALGSPASAQQGDKFGWSITPYIWGPKTTVDLTFRNTDIGQGDISFSDLLDTLDAAFMIQVEGGKGRWSAFGDLTYLDTSDTTERTVFTIDAENKQLLADAALAFWPDGVGSPLSLFGGMRYTQFDDRYGFRLTADNTPVGEQRTKKDYYDVLMGLRYRFDFSKRWSLLTRGDMSFGDSEGIFLLQANFAYTVGKRQQNRILFGYQYKAAEFEDGDLNTDFTYHGPMAGFNFRF